MIIRKKRIVNIDKYLTQDLSNKNLYIGIIFPNLKNVNLQHIGFSDKAEIGEQILPNHELGKTSFFNSEGGFKRSVPQSIETVYREQERSFTDWHGNHHTRTFSIPYKRYKREQIKPIGMEIKIASRTDGTKLIMSNLISNQPKNKDLIKHTINLFLEIFQECEIFSEDMESIIKSPIVRVGWDILPKGKYVWEKLKQELQPVIDKTPEGNKGTISGRFEFINSSSPDFVAIGNAGFTGYLVFGFPSKSIFILESIYTNNAIYVFENDWEELTQLTKAEIINGNLHKERIVHSEGWKEKVRKYI